MRVEEIRRQTKLKCIASSRQLKQTLAKSLGDTGCKVTTSGEMLGIDYAAGGQMRTRATQQQRVRKTKKRRGRLGWWRSIGGDAAAVARQGALPAMGYGSIATGITGSLMRDMRKL